jgi:hypothetical protein
MIEIMHDFDIVSWNDIEERVKVKRKKLSKWSDLVLEWEVEEDIYITKVTDGKLVLERRK